MEDVWAAIMVIAGGLFAGGGATFAWSRVPIWSRMPVPEFITDFDQTIRRTDIVQPALAVIASAAGFAFAFSADGSARLFAALGAGGFILVLLASLAVLVPLQRRIIATPSAQAQEIEAMRRRWFSGNLGRSLLSVASFALLVIATTV
jgi:anthrone oxygenase-like protein